MNELPSQIDIFENRLDYLEKDGSIRVLLKDDLDDIYIAKILTGENERHQEYSAVEYPTVFGATLIVIADSRESHAVIDDKVRSLHLINGTRAQGGGIFDKSKGFIRDSALFGGMGTKEKRILIETMHTIENNRESKKRRNYY
ncbi:hypothetical protein KA001_00610 [Patescibacteria group bacterium]|nr:hypothetical protein [Patescibacteria group bacterium]